MGLRKNKVRICDEQRFERSGQRPAKSRKAVEQWADFQRRTNGLNVRIVKENGGYEAYLSVKRRKGY